MTAPPTGRFEPLRTMLLDRSLCPVCGAPLTGPRCLWCGVPLDGAAAATVLRLSVAAADALAEREVGLRALVAERDARFAGRPVGPAAPAPHTRTGPVKVRAGAANPGTRAPGSPVRPAGAVRLGPGTRPVSRPTATRPRWRVQTVLQTLGAGLLSAAGIVFLVFSWGVLDLEVRATVVATGTVVVFVLAGVLARKGLRQGAEAVGAVAAVLLLLDAWALRRTGVLTIGQPGVYASSAAVVCAVILGWWGRSARLRVGTVGAALLWLVAPLPLATLDPSVQTFAWALLGTAAVSWIRHVPSVGRAAAQDPPLATARAVLSAGAVAAWPLAVLMSLATLGTSPDAALTLLAAAAVMGAAQSLLSRVLPWAVDGTLAPWWHAAAVGTAAVMSIGGAALRVLPPETALAVIASGCALALIGLVDRMVPAPTVSDGPRRPPGVVRTVVETPATTLIPAAVLLVVVGTGGLVPDRRATLLALLLVAGTAAVLDRRRSNGAAADLGTATAARITAVAAALLTLVSAHQSGLGLAASLAGCAAVSVHARTWGVGRTWAARSTAVAAPLGLAALGALAHATGAADADAVAIAASAGPALLALVVMAPDRSRPERQIAFGTAAGAATAGWALQALVPGWWGPSSLLPAVVCCLLVVLALASEERRIGSRAAVGAAGLAAPVLALSTVSAVAALQPGHGSVGTILLAASTGGASVLLALVARATRGPAAAAAATAGGWVTVAAALTAALLDSRDLAATVLLVAAVVALVRGVADHSPVLRWGALTLATIASWTVLGSGRPGVPELFTAPTAIVVATVGVVRTRRGRSDATALVAGGLALALLPTALLRGALPLPLGLQVDRRIVTTAAAAALTLLAALRARRSRTNLVTALAALGACLALLGPGRAAVDAAFAPGAPGMPELLALLAAVLLLVAASSVRLAAPTPVSGPVRAVEPWAVTATAVVPIVLATGVGPAGVLRTTVLAAVGTVLTLAGAARTARDEGPWVRHLMGVGILVSAGATICAGRALPDAPGGVVPGALGVLLIVTVLLRPPLRLHPTDVVRATSAAALLVPLLWVRTGSWRPVLWLGLALTLLAGAWLVRNRPGSGPAVRLVSAVAAGVGLAGPWWHVVAPLLHAAAPVHGPVERWSVPAALVLVGATLLAWPRPSGLPSRLTLAAPGLGLAGVPSLLGADATPLGQARLFGVLALGAAIAVVGQERRLGGRTPAVVRDAARAVATGVTIAAAASLAASLAGPWAADVPVVALGLLLSALGARRTAADPTVGSWRTLAPGTVLAVVVPALVSGVDPAPWRPVTAVLLAVVATVAGAVLRRQAPFVLGAATLVVVTVLQLGPWAGQVLARTQGWVLLALCGTVLLALGLRYERRLAQAREAVRFVATMR